MVLGLEFGSANITYIAFGNNILEIIKDPTRVGDIFVLTQGIIPIKGDMKNAVNTLMSKLQTLNITHVGFSRNIGEYKVNQLKNIEKLRNFLCNDISTIIDIGSKTTNIHTFTGTKLNNTFTNGKCAAGSGSFIETMADRLDFSLEKFINLAYETEDYVSLSGRCAVFCESDIVHLFQKGITKDKIAHGITRNVALNVKTLLGTNSCGKALFVGGVSKNKAVLKDLKSVFETENIEISKYPFNAFATIFSPVEMDKNTLKNILLCEFSKEEEIPRDKPLILNTQNNLTEKHADINNKHFDSVALGVDIGSVSTKGALIAKEDEDVVILASFYRKTLGNPIDAVKEVLDHIHKTVKEKNITFDKCYAGTTGSGRYLTGDFLGADLIKNEITAQVAGTVCFYPTADTIFEIGGQDSKYISLNQEEIIDFEMNKVCAAGTGAFLEKQAKTLGVSIEKFGDLALSNTAPPILDHNCTVFTEMAMKDLIGKVPACDLAAALCLSSAKNFLNKNLENRKIGDKIVFSGAVAFNKGMVAAFENLCQKEILVSPYPHINGAIGIASLTLKEKQKEEPKFIGFSQVLSQKYNLSVFKCTSCHNFCHVSVFETEGKKYYYNDRCEKYSGKQKNTYQINLFKKYHEIIEENMERVPQFTALGKTIGYPRGMFFNEYYPLFGAFFKACGFDIVLSDETNRSLAETGSLLTGNKPCFPFKTAMGHFDNILSKKCDYIFLPRIINGESPNHKNTHYCPFMQAGCDILVQKKDMKKYQNNLDRPIENTDIIISPTFYMADGEKAIKKILVKLGETLGAKPQYIKKAANVAFDAWLDFKDDLILTGKNTMDLYKGYIYAVLGHPYVLYDNFLNMNIGDKLSKQGYMPIPMDFIPYKENTSWHIYQKEIEKKLELGAYLKNHPEIKSIVLSYYACGMDAFSNKFYKEELGCPCYIMNIDEHTSDAGIETRLEAFGDVKNQSHPTKNNSHKISDFSKIKDKILWLPATDFSSEILAKSFNLFGINAQTLEESSDISMENARKEINEDVCLPCLATMEDMLARINSEDFDPEKEAFFQAGANGPCRLGMYPQRQKLVLSKKGNIPITVIDNNFFKSGLDINFALLTWNSLLLHDYIFKLLLHARPYETQPGAAEKIYEKYAYTITSVMRTALREIKKQSINKFESIPTYKSLLKEACLDFENITDRSIEKQKIGITGEFYIKLNNRCNKNIVKYLERKGFEVLMSTLTEYFHYSNYISLDIIKDKLEKNKKILKTLPLLGEKTLREKAQKIIEKQEKIYNDITAPYLGMREISSDELVKLGSNFLSKSVTGESICTLGKSSSFFNENVAGIIALSPFNCMPGGVVDMLSDNFRKEHENIPFISLFYDGYEDNYKLIDNFLDNL